MERRDLQPRLQRGETVGRYVVLDLVGRGAMGEVYKAHDTALDRLVALKVLTVAPGDRQVEESIAVREGQMLALVRHPGVVGVFDVGVHGPSTFIALEYVEGRSLRDALSDGALGPREIRSIALQLAEGLAAIHEAGLIHRDIKPGNILIDETGSARIADLGVAKLLIDMAHDPEGTGGTWVGTPGYRAPEVEAGGRATQAADVYSLCASLCEAAPEPPPRQWWRLLRVLRRGIATEPSGRPTARDLAAALDPKPRIWLWVAAAATIGALAVVATQPTDVEPAVDPAMEHWAEAQARLAEVWNPSVVSALSRWANNPSTGVPGEDWTRREIVRVLAQRAEGWTQAAADAATLGDSEETVLHERCLDVAKARLDSAIELTLAREESPDPVLAWLHELPVAGDCLRSDVHRRSFEHWTDASAAQHLEDLGRLQRAEGAIYFGEGDAARQIIEALADRDDLGVLEGHLSYLQGLLTFKTRGAPAEAVPFYREAIVASETYADRLLLARATLELSRMLILLGDFDEARFAVQRAVAAVGPRPGAELLTLRLLDGYANVEGQLGTEETRQEVLAHLEEIEARIDPGGFEALYLHIARAQIEPGETDEEELAAWQLASVYMGPNHELTRNWREQYYRDACRRLGVEQCIESYERLRGELTNDVIAVTMQAYALSRAGHDWAAWDLRSSIQDAMDQSGKGAQMLIGVLALSGLADADPMGDAVERSKLAEGAVELIVPLGLPEYSAGARMLAADVAASLGDRDRAEAHLQQIEALGPEAPVVQTFARAKVSLTLGESTRALGQLEELYAGLDATTNNIWFEEHDLDKALCQAAFEAGSEQQVTDHCNRAAEQIALPPAERERAMVRIALRRARGKTH